LWLIHLYSGIGASAQSLLGQAVGLAISSGSCSKLWELDLSLNFLEPDGGATIAAQLRQGLCPELMCLNLFFTTLQQSDIHGICFALKEGCCPKLEALLLGHNSGMTVEAMGALVLACQRGYLKQLQLLELPHCRLEEGAAERLAEVGSKKKVV